MNPEVHAVTQALTQYWIANPCASDSSAGAARWWLGGRYRQAVVEAALADLQAAGRVERCPAADGRVRWRWREAAP
jgi:hypothetical protein